MLYTDDPKFEFSLCSCHTQRLLPRVSHNDGFAIKGVGKERRALVGLRWRPLGLRLIHVLLMCGCHKEPVSTLAQSFFFLHASGVQPRAVETQTTLILLCRRLTSQMTMFCRLRNDPAISHAHHAVQRPCICIYIRLDDRSSNRRAQRETSAREHIETLTATSCIARWLSTVR